MNMIDEQEQIIDEISFCFGSFSLHFPMGCEFDRAAVPKAKSKRVKEKRSLYSLAKSMSSTVHTLLRVNSKYMKERGICVRLCCIVALLKHCCFYHEFTSF